MFEPTVKASLLIVGLDEHDSTIQKGSVMYLTPDVFLNEDGKNEYCIKAVEILEGVESGLAGYVGREFHKLKGIYEFQLVQVVKLYSDSTNPQEMKVSTERGGVCLCRIIS
jgi:flagellin-specific chaperone FliS